MIPQDDVVAEEVLCDANGKALLRVRHRAPKYDTLEWDPGNNYPQGKSSLLSEMPPPEPRKENRKARRARASKERRHVL